MTKQTIACACIIIMACVFTGCSHKNGGEMVYRVDHAVSQASGKVKAVSRLPQKDSSPYWDCITAVWLTDVKSDNDEINNAKDGILVYVVSLDGGEETDNAAISEGDTVTMELVPWKNAENKYGSYQRIEIDDPDSYVLDAWFKNDKVAREEEEKDD